MDHATVPAKPHAPTQANQAQSASRAADDGSQHEQDFFTRPVGSRRR